MVVNFLSPCVFSFSLDALFACFQVCPLSSGLSRIVMNGVSHDSPILSYKQVHLVSFLFSRREYFVFESRQEGRRKSEEC